MTFGRDLTRDWKLVCFVLAFAVAVPGCATQSYTYSPPEQVELATKPFPGFIEDSESAARIVAYNLIGNRDVTIGDPVLAYQLFAQLEWLVNEMKTVYVTVRPSMLQDLEEARNALRANLGLGANIPVVDAIRIYAERAKSPNDDDRRHLTQGRQRIEIAMTKAGYAVERYNRVIDRQQDDDDPRPN